jgi:hypothetical protein
MFISIFTEILENLKLLITAKIVHKVLHINHINGRYLLSTKKELEDTAPACHDRFLFMTYL